MSTPEQPASPPLTRKQLREIRNTGATPVIDPAAAAAAAEAAAEAAQTAVEDAAPEQDAAPAPISAVPVSAPPARPAEPVTVADPPVADASVDLGVSPLTRRQARQQERIRTASVPVISADVIAAVNAETAQPPVAASPVPATKSPDTELVELLTPPATDEHEIVTASEDDESAEPGRPTVNPALGAELLTADSSGADLSPSFDQLLSRQGPGSVATPNALIVSQGSGSDAIVAPVAATGEIIITGTFNLPEGLGSLGHAPGVADGKEVDAVLVDGELPAHSSPTPIAASAAVSTVKGNVEQLIQPPAPEKGNKLMLSLAITAGVLAAALVGVLIVALVNGVFA